MRIKTRAVADLTGFSQKMAFSTAVSSMCQSLDKSRFLWDGESAPL